MFGKILRAGLRICGVAATLVMATVCMVSRGVAAGRPEAMFGGLPAAEPVVLEATPAVVAFVDVPVGDTYTQTVRLTNVSRAGVTVMKISGSATEMGINGVALPLVLEAGSSTTFTVSYKPTIAGSNAGTISVMTSASATPWTLDVKASAISNQLELTASEVSVEFGDIATGSGNAKEITLSNVGNADVAISKIEIAGEDFSISGGGAVTLNPGQQMNVNVRFDPRNGGGRNGMMSVFSNTADSPLQISLSGAASAASQQSIALKWDKGEMPGNGYFVYRSSESGGPYSKLQTSATPEAEFMDSGLAAGHTYYYVVTSVAEDGSESGYSEQIVVNVP
jgi:hypothetical protein